MQRVVEPELLDELPCAEPLAVGSRGDLRRLNFIMGHAAILSRAVSRHRLELSSRSRPVRIVELGSGDGTLLLQVARRLRAMETAVAATLVDRQKIVSPETQRAFRGLNWIVENAETDVFAWLKQSPDSVDVIMANLFLHHFSDELLAELLRSTAAKTNLFIACEPRRSVFGLAAARSLLLLGCNKITRHDAVVSVRAGFAGRELSGLWPAEGKWRLSERRAGWFSHRFIAQRHA